MGKGLGVDALLVVNPVDIRYLTGFVGDDSWALVRAGSNKIVVLSDFRFEQQIEREAPQARAVMRKKSLSDELAGVVKKYGIETLGVQASYVTLAQRTAMSKAMRRAKVKVAIKAVDDGLIEQRAVKSADEVKLIVKAGQIQQQAYREMLAYIKPGQTEAEVAAFLEYRMRALGADGVSFPSIVAADGNAALPHAIPGRKKIRKHGIVLFDWGAKYQGYCSDMTRVISVGGKMKGKMAEIYQICLEAQLAAIDAIRPGVRLADVDKVARDIITKAGYGKLFGHSLGHGIGLDIHESPVLASRATGVLEPGHVVTVEPGIYLPDVGGVRIEDDVLVTEVGKKVLTDLPKTIESTMI